MKIKVEHIGKEFKDERGYLSRVIDQDDYIIRSVLHIVRKKGTRGADHYHKKDAHYIYVYSGKVKYGEKDMTKKNSKIEYVTLNPGDLVLSKPMKAHSTVFLEDSVIFAFTTEKRDQKKYEKDTVRIDDFIKDK